MFKQTPPPSPAPTFALALQVELHISSDIAAAVWAFWSSTQDATGPWLNTTAWPLLEGIATFWMSKLAIDNPGARPGAPLSLLHVQGPDEYHDNVNNSVYTNAGVIMALNHAAAVGAMLGVNVSVSLLIALDELCECTVACVVIIVGMDEGRVWVRA